TEHVQWDNAPITILRLALSPSLNSQLTSFAGNLQLWQPLVLFHRDPFAAESFLFLTGSLGKNGRGENEHGNDRYKCETFHKTLLLFCIVHYTAGREESTRL